MSSDPTPSLATYLASPEALHEPSLEIRDQAYKHLFRSRRMAVGDSIRLVDGEGVARSGVVVEIDRKHARVDIGGELPSHEPEHRLHLKVGALRPERADWLVEKTTELGVFSITFITTERTPRQYGKGRLDRLQRVAAAAVEQCGRSRLPRLSGVTPWRDALQEPTLGDAFVLDPDGPPASAAFQQALQGAGSSGDTTLWIGPEGGFSDDELRRLTDDLRIAPVGLSCPILRVETAAVAATALCLLTRRPPSQS